MKCDCELRPGAFPPLHLLACDARRLCPRLCPLRSVLERYPNNGKLLKVYGKFQEDCRNDPRAATK